MVDLFTAGRKIIKATLEANTAYQTTFVFTGFPGVYKTFANHVDANTPMPYVTIRHYTGGNDPKDPRQTADIFYKVTAHSEVDADQDALRDVLYTALHQVTPVFPGDVENVAVIAPIYEFYPYEDRYLRQSREFFQVGGIYRLQLSLCVEIEV